MAKNRILYINVVLFSLTFVFFYGGRIPYMIFYTTISIFVVSIAYTLTVYFCLSFKAYVDSPDIIKGSLFNYSIDIKNKSPLFFPYVKIVYEETDMFILENGRMTLSVGPFAGTGLKFALTSKYRGRYKIDNYEIKIMDFLGLIRLPIKKAKGEYVTVYPRIVPIDRVFHNTRFNIDSISQTSSSIEDTSSVSDIRSYYNGDSMKRIHWKLTAKTRQIKIKNFEKVEKPSVLLLLDLSRTEGDEPEAILRTEDKLIEAYVSVLYYFLKIQINVNVIFHDGELVSIKADNMGLFQPLYEKASTLDFVGGADCEEILDYISVGGANLSNICVFSSKLRKTLIERLHACTERGSFVSLVYTNEKNALIPPDGEGPDTETETETKTKTKTETKTKTKTETKTKIDTKTKTDTKTDTKTETETETETESPRSSSWEEIKAEWGIDIETEQLKVYAINYESKLDEVFEG